VPRPQPSRRRVSRLPTANWVATGAGRDGFGEGRERVAARGTTGIGSLSRASRLFGRGCRSECEEEARARCAARDSAAPNESSSSRSASPRARARGPASHWGEKWRRAEPESAAARVPCLGPPIPSTPPGCGRTSTASAAPRSPPPSTRSTSSPAQVRSPSRAPGWPERASKGRHAHAPSLSLSLSLCISVSLFCAPQSPTRVRVLPHSPTPSPPPPPSAPPDFGAFWHVEVLARRYPRTLSPSAVSESL
jgi:hypothetical protein